MTERQTQMLNIFLDGYEAKITSKNWASLAKCSKNTAIRDIQDLVSKNILVEDIPGAKRPTYSIVFDSEDITQFFTDVCITQENGIPYLNALFKGHRTVCERMLALDAERYQKGELPLSNMLHKYCSYLMARDQKTAHPINQGDYAYSFVSLKRKNFISVTPLKAALNALILALNDSAKALVALLTKKFKTSS